VPGSKKWKEHLTDEIPFSIHGMSQAAVRTHSVKEQIVEVFQESLICVAHKF
jgi:hypothetical protein